MKRILLLTLLGLGLAAATANANEQEKLEKLRQRISALQQELEKTNESKSEAADALRESERAISNSNRKLRELGRRQQEASGELTQVQQQTARLRLEMQGQQAQLAALLYQEYLGGRQDYLQLLLDSREPNQAARDLHYYGYIARTQAAWLNTLRGNLERLGTLTGQAREKSDEIAALQKDASAERKVLEQDRQAHQQVLLRISAQMRQQNREIGHLRHNEARLAQLAEKLALMFAQSNASPFEALKGRLVLPVKGAIRNRFGARHPDGTVFWKGWFVRAPSGQEVKAVAPGQVVFADWLRGFGNLLIVDHGKGYMSLYGYNETLYKQVGDTIRGGDTIAAVGNSGGNEDSGLYFELRHEGKPIDPAKWVAKR